MEFPFDFLGEKQTRSSGKNNDFGKGESPLYFELTSYGGDFLRADFSTQMKISLSLR